ncbi:hypothetical protein NLJ89_g10397 [Agrocybe chaxingu]|uniref:Uncharacterized protein n=1 Tax=Agrocybe chaxingu TaxID=84603 RepID=A0A9W8JQV2_9AGAR|nr:hypothetical protein NLJ89_g10397 [Agrocybe chaxingu]
MQFRTTLVPLALAALAAATTTVTATTPSANAGGLLGFPILGPLFSVLGLVISPINAIVDLNCNPITVIRGGGFPALLHCAISQWIVLVEWVIAIGFTPVNPNL